MDDKYTEGYDAKPKETLYSQGEALRTVVARAEIAAADSDGQLYILARGVSLDSVLVNALVPKGHGAVTGGTDYDLGIYKNTGTFDVPVWTAVDADIFFDDVDMSSARTACIDLATSATDATIGELLNTSLTSTLYSRENAAGEFAIVLTANTVGTAAVDIEFNLKLAPAH